MLHRLAQDELRLSMSAAHPETIDLARVWDDFHASLLAFIVRRVRDRDSAEDILQDVMLRVHRHAGELERPSAVGAWVHQIARNAIVDHYRTAAVRREQPSGVELGEDVPSAPEPDLREPRGEIAACLRPLVDELTPLHREALQLTDLEARSRRRARQPASASRSPG